MVDSTKYFSKIAGDVTDIQKKLLCALSFIHEIKILRTKFIPTFKFSSFYFSNHIYRISQ